MENKLMSNWFDDLPSQAPMLTWRVGCSCIDCKVARENSAQVSALKLGQ